MCVYRAPDIPSNISFQALEINPANVARVLKFSRRHVIVGCRELKITDLWPFFTIDIIFTLNFVIIGHMFQTLCGGAIVLSLSRARAHTHTHTHTLNKMVS